ncbi:MAG: pyridoxamine 5'-phosphate oxidase family protein [Dehalococcoidia bacterium]|jgi:predicted pyridoxine 5'-phosphate oxidase superfamily flavin-nucleotide-binding protein|nr:pyridoxamine 5'-phosphate oxidase family protein [Dehalococcoidia bacterium]
MIHLTEEMRESVNGARASGNPCIVATASPDGTPNAGFIGTVMAYDETSLAYRDRSGRRPLDHIETDPKVVVLFRDSAREVGWKFRCTAAVHRDGPVYDEVMGRLAESGMPAPQDIEVAIVVLRIDQILTLFGEILQEREPGLTW